MSMMLHIMLKTSVASIIRILQLNQKDFSSSISTRFASSTATCFSAILCATSARATSICATTRAARSVPLCSAYSAVTRSRPAVTASGSCTLPVAATATAVTAVAATAIAAAEALSLSVVRVSSSAAAAFTAAVVAVVADGAVSPAAKKLLGLYLPFRRMCRGLRTTTSAETLATCGDSSSSAAAGGGRASSIESSSICFSSTSSSSSSC
mmetsp:Transcript_35800/g.57575  ORF Transcript_35800/g.57575 Transcript_35800/m.57575 type:complete len:210 (-) Transcript_35800:275-904(-)